MDKLFHLLIGFVCYIFFRKHFYRRPSLFLVFLLALSKEIFDFFHYEPTLTEQTLDILFTLAGPTLYDIGIYLRSNNYGKQIQRRLDEKR
jgi:hypothetical protein